MPLRDREELGVDITEPTKPKNSADTTRPKKATAAAGNWLLAHAAAAANKKAGGDSSASSSPAVTSKAVAASSNSTSSGGALNLKQFLTDPEWSKALAPVFEMQFTKDIESTLARDEKAGIEVFPPRKDIFSALNVCPLSEVKVVLIGQDPYHDNNQAHGMCFSVRPGIKVPPSLVNMYKELATDIPGFAAPKHGYLMRWAEQGILMLNATLTVQAHKANSHEKCGWQQFTDKIIDCVNSREQPAVFLLWGNFAKKKAQRVNRSKHKVVECAHPSPLSATKWWGCKTFSQCNDALKALGQQPIDWSLPQTVSQSSERSVSKELPGPR